MKRIASLVLSTILAASLALFGIGSAFGEEASREFNSPSPGWNNVNDAWYYVDEFGAVCQDQWVDTNYYVGVDGKMLTNAWVGEYYVGPDGAYVPDKDTAISQAQAASNINQTYVSKAPQVITNPVMAAASEKSSAETSPSSAPSAGSVSPVQRSLYLNLNGITCVVNPYAGAPSVEINGGQPAFTEADLAKPCVERYSKLDKKGRCGYALVHVCEKTLPTEERGSISSVAPSGWQSVEYDFIDGGLLYNRSHLIGYQLSGENANKKNLITGTSYMNAEGMLPYENQISDYVHTTGNSVLLRVTPIFENDNLVASGVVMEAMSVEDVGAALSFCVYCYNVQPGVMINYATGENEPAPETLEAQITAAAEGAESLGSEAGYATTTPIAEEIQEETADQAESVTASYVANMNTMKFHYPFCSSADDIKAKNRWDFEGTRDELIAQGYVPCKRCNP